MINPDLGRIHDLEAVAQHTKQQVWFSARAQWRACPQHRIEIADAREHVEARRKISGDPPIAAERRITALPLAHMGLEMLGETEVLNSFRYTDATTNHRDLRVVCEDARERRNPIGCNPTVIVGEGDHVTLS